VIQHFLSKQFLGFAAVGGVAALLHWAARLLLSVWLSFPVAILLAYAVGLGVAFILNRAFVFPKSTKPMRRQARDFLLVNLAFLPVVLGTAMGLEAVFREYRFTAHPQAIAHGIAVMVPALATFLIYKFFAFQDIEYGRT